MKLNLTQEQVNQILNALGQLPYIEVYELITTIQQQGQTQLQEAEATQPPTTNIQEALVQEVATKTTNGKK